MLNNETKKKVKKIYWPALTFQTGDLGYQIENT
jgi:hypothetical protein